MNATAEQIKRAEQQANQFVTFERALQIIIKQDAKSQWSPMSKRKVEKMELRNSTFVPTRTSAEIMEANAKKNLPSSLR